MSRLVKVFVACSVDGFIAGEGDDLSWLPQPTGEVDQDYGYGSFFETIGAMLMGRRTFDVVSGFDPWPYGDRPVLVATHRPLEPPRSTVQGVEGSIEELLTRALASAAGKDVYLDGGELIQQALAADLVDELTLSIIPVLLGRGRPLFGRMEAPKRLQLRSVRHFDSALVQIELHRPDQTTG